MSRPIYNLSRVAEKHQEFEVDTYFLEGMATLMHVAGAEAIELAMRSSLLIVKPDGIVGRRAKQVIDWLLRQRYAIVAARPVRFDRHMIRAMWGYHWNAMTVDHKFVIDLLMQRVDSLVLVLRVAAPQNREVPAAVRLSEMKGSANPAERAVGQLRHEVAFSSKLLNVVHSPDEPADFVREVAVLFDREERLQLIREIASGREVCPARLAEKVDMLYRRTENQDVEGICEQVRLNPTKEVDISSLSEHLPKATWADIVNLACLVQNEIQGIERRIPKPAVGAWLIST